MCAAPLALAGTLQADLFARGAVGSEAGLSVDTGIGSSGNGKSSDNSKSSNNNNNGGNNVIIQEDTTINEVIIIWVNNGGGQATTTVTSTTTVAGAASVVATHTVSCLARNDNSYANISKGGCWWKCWACLLTRYDRSLYWRHGHFHIRITEPHRHTIRFHHSL
jgi:hypothetical protein